MTRRPLHPLVASTRILVLVVAASTPALTAGCGGGEESNGVTVAQELRGDTVVTVSRGEAERLRIETAEIVWQSDEFGGRFPTMARMGDRLLIGDAIRIHVVSLQDGGAHTFGRAGEGPAEFQGEIQSVGEFGTDTIGVFDAFRVYLFSIDGGFLTSYRVTPRSPFVWPLLGGNDVPVSPLVRSGNGVVWERQPSIWEFDGGTVEKALLWHDLEADTAAVLETWSFQRVDPYPGQPPRPRDVFSFLTMHAIAPDGRVAAGSPADYCIQTFRSFEADARTWCRERSAVRAAAGFDDLSDLPLPPENILWEVMAWQNPVDSLPHFDRLIFSESGDLWVRLYHDEFAHVHPVYRLPSMGAWEAEVREWEVFDTEGVLVRHVTVPGAFDLRVIGDGEAFGFLTLDTGEVVVARVDLGEAAGEDSG